MNMETAIGYVRVSTDIQDLNRQKMLISDFCDKKNIKLLYCEEDFAISGADLNRKGYNNIKNLTNKDCNYIVVSELSRFSRNSDIINGVLTVVNDLINNGISVCFIDEGDKIYKNKLEIIDIFRISIKAESAAEERIKIKERMKSGKEYLLRENPYRHFGEKLQYGYKLNPIYKNDNIFNYNKIVINEEEIKMVIKLYQLIGDEGYTVRKATAELNRLGYLSPNKNKICVSFVQRIINSKMYIGERHYGFDNNKKEIKYNVPDLIIKELVDTDLWNRVQRVRKTNYIRYNDKSDNHHYNPLKGIIFCSCGRAMSLYIHNNNKTKATYKYYKCSRDKGENNCNLSVRQIRYNYFIKALWEVVKLTLKDTDYKLKETEKIKKCLIDIDTITNNLKGINYDFERVEKEISKKNRLINKPNLADSVFDSINNSILILEKELNGIKKRKEDAKFHLMKATQELNNAQKKDLKRLSSSNDITEKEKGEYFNKLLEKIVFTSIGKKEIFLFVTFKNGLKLIIYNNHSVGNSNSDGMYYLPFEFDDDYQSFYVVEGKTNDISNFKLPEKIKHPISDLNNYITSEPIIKKSQYKNMY